ncbi:hypothetical protein BDV29DRAFT_164038 [Aspergillus leporis]|jgi:hypothetical protein|uniref:Uncharacterized protein n=1 Tax=Aspergillus leporis TaxID=41062 RepID=A0A5N5XJ01_9EURO|nr:hypothetical protein BDV29DRAFT_164038 [Aspergillus leporis]
MVTILKKVEMITKFGEEPSQFVGLLRPVLRRFVDCFVNTTGEAIKDFWRKCIHESGFSGASTLSS